MNNTNSKKHLTLEDRERMEELLKNGKNFSYIAAELHKSPSTISREVKNHRLFCEKARRDNNNCIFKKECTRHLVCGKLAQCGGTRKCSTCRVVRCDTRCDSYQKYECPDLKKSPYVCNGCHKKGRCQCDKYYYRAKDAHAESISCLKTSRQGIDLTPEEINNLDTLITPLLKQGQSLDVIRRNHEDEISCSLTTLYTYIRDGYLTSRNIDLRRTVRYKKRKRKTPKDEQYLKRAARIGRTYEDFKAYINENDVPVIEMDTVVGCRGSQKVVLTMYFRNSHFLLIFLLKDHQQKRVLQVFDALDKALGAEIFNETFPVILTDNGSEFMKPETFEFRTDGTRRTRIFYCDPSTPGQKGSIEKVHELIRYCVPKGNSFDSLSQEQITTMTNHINSYSRKSLGHCCPFDIAKLQLDNKLFDVLGLERVPEDEVELTPHVFQL